MDEIFGPAPACAQPSANDRANRITAAGEQMARRAAAAGEEMVARAHARTAAFAAAAEEPAGVGPYTWRCDLSRALPAFRAGEAEAAREAARVEAESAAATAAEAVKPGSRSRLKLLRKLGRSLVGSVSEASHSAAAGVRAGVRGAAASVPRRAARRRRASLPGRSDARRKSLPRRSDAAPPQYLCPVLGEVMTDPVTTCDGHTYEREAIEMWFRTYAERYPLAASAPSPVTGAMLASTALVSNIALRQVIETWREGREGLGG
ncbi:hypothetical protein EMIHUDRAFT_368189 [Emiliania huxleyi CCMP1516]|uniref:U-box domain-containing protein n=2 Tax=Emiliania huxleyi TaxID=2903 RepID=A0A0D3JIJ4_EMIH1|nr:hypothetical protein EMIHUDRAFT_368189 [Emiliania huxleyi CCMP1516]EOD23329.1 hypothetical protein EMIHUDRAFT_368189 [Emiliania huxleyi CCMP1516]|eukprot:XP_005775758.1 hypothetical protein EMIHUDRAFT_368189 [Emiliania huxleyi CCMP1516]